MKKVTPLLAVDAIEPCLEFWVARLGFETTVSVPHGDRLGFAILVKGACEIMLQTFDSLAADVAAAVPPSGGSILYCDVESLDAIVDDLAGVPVVIARRKTDYGAEEIFVREPGGHVVGFAQFGA